MFAIIVHRLLGDGMLFFLFFIFNSVYITVCIMSHEHVIEVQ